MVRVPLKETFSCACVYTSRLFRSEQADSTFRPSAGGKDGSLALFYAALVR